MPEPTPHQHGARHAAENIARAARQMALQPPLPPGATPEAQAYLEGFQDTLRRILAGCERIAGENGAPAAPDERARG